MATWDGWNNGTTTSCNATINFGQDTTTLASTTVWSQWAMSGATDNTWYYWTGGNVIGNDSYQGPTAEELEAARLANEEREQQQREAEVRAEKILNDNLDEGQRKAYAERKMVPITTARGRKYLVKKGRAGNVYRLDEHGHEVEKFCIHPDEAIPDQDCMLAQILWLRWCEEEFLRVANVTKWAA